MTTKTDWGYIDAGHYDEMVEATRMALGNDIRSTFGAKVKPGESITDYSSTTRRINGPCTVITTIHRDGGITQKVTS